MSELERVYVFIPEYIKNRLEEDCELFEIYKNYNNDENEINLSHFCNLLIIGYDEMYIQENNDVRNAIETELDKTHLREEDKNSISTKIIRNLGFIDINLNKDENYVRIGFKPINDSEDIISRIKTEYAGKRKASEYFRNMFINYCSKPLYIRERIIFSQNYKDITRACRRKQYLTFSTIWNPKKKIKIMPYKVAVGQEMFNYLLCAGINELTGEQEARTYRINRIDKCRSDNDNEQISDLIKKHLELMSENGPQFAINDDEKYCVRLTPKGVKSYNRIYLGRPKAIKREMVGEDYYYYFNTSENQIFLYFRRFGPGEAEVISPQGLRDKIIRFHRGALEMYKED